MKDGSPVILPLGRLWFTLAIMPLHRITHLDDPRVQAYQGLKDRELALLDGRFIAEGAHVVRRLLASDYPVDSVFLAEHRVEEIAPLAHPDVPIFVAEADLVSSVMGFKFHSGVIACGRRKEPMTLSQMMEGPQGAAKAGSTLVVCPEIINHDNLGSLIRVCAGMGAAGMLLGERSCDPFWRRSVRVSMGTIFSLPIRHSPDLLADLESLRRDWQMQMVATVVESDAQPIDQAKRPPVPDRLALLVGSESQGLHRRWLQVCDRRVTIPMSLGTDSLNVVIATAVFLYHFNQRGLGLGPRG